MYADKLIAVQDTKRQYLEELSPNIFDLDLLQKQIIKSNISDKEKIEKRKKKKRKKKKE